MRIIFLLFFGLVLVTADIEQAPVAVLTCQLCATGSRMAAYFLPVGHTCEDLDVSLQALGKPGCTPQSLNPPLDRTNLTAVLEAYDKLVIDFANVSASRRDLVVAYVVTLFFTLILFVVIILIIRCKIRHEQNTLTNILSTRKQ